ncbi:it plays a direct role in the translocation of protons across the membrane [Vibrio sp. B1FLJ16]|nr:it plays a direct role in the translocation of protons across the membrane [Vibrio sp. B1FLJ16]CAE6926831.1 it plays a direct role in the translocation of protons across the membrane [Vibrio sp. B1FLJ16]
MAAPGEALTSSGYIAHHLSNLSLGKLGLVEEASFWNVHIDSLFFFLVYWFNFPRNLLQSSEENNSRCTG